jgi:Tfp pilus assembly protein PilO
MGKLTKQSWLMLGVTLAIVIGFSATVFLFQQGKLRELRADIEGQQQLLESENQKASVVPALFQEIEEMRTRYKEFDRQLPKQQDLGEFLALISEKVGQKGLSGQLTEPGSPVKGELFHTLPINMRFKGDYVSTGQLLDDLHEMERLTRVQRLEITRSQASDDIDAPLDIEMQINIYFTES